LKIIIEDLELLTIDRQELLLSLVKDYEQNIEPSLIATRRLEKIIVRKDLEFWGLEASSITDVLTKTIYINPAIYRKDSEDSEFILSFFEEIGHLTGITKEDLVEEYALDNLKRIREEI